MALKRFGSRPVLPDAEVTISKYAEDYVDSGKPLGIYIARHFGRSVEMFIALCRLPCHQIVLSARPEGATIRHAIAALCAGANDRIDERCTYPATCAGPVFGWPFEEKIAPEGASGATARPFLGRGK